MGDARGLTCAYSQRDRDRASKPSTLPCAARALCARFPSTPGRIVWTCRGRTQGRSGPTAHVSSVRAAVCLRQPLGSEADGSYTRASLLCERLDLQFRTVSRVLGGRRLRLVASRLSRPALRVCRRLWWPLAMKPRAARRSPVPTSAAWPSSRSPSMVSDRFQNRVEALSRCSQVDHAHGLADEPLDHVRPDVDRNQSWLRRALRAPFIKQGPADWRRSGLRPLRLEGWGADAEAVGVGRVMGAG